MITVVSAQPVSAPDGETRKEWGTFTVGSGTPEWLHGGIAYHNGSRHLYQIAFNSALAVNVFGGPAPHVAAVSVSYGRRMTMKYAVAAAFAGPAVVWGAVQNEDGDYRRFVTAGAAANVQLYLRPFVNMGSPGGIPLKRLGFGVELQANGNPVQNVAGFRYGIYVGTAL